MTQNDHDESDEQCVYCSEHLADIADAVEHHHDEHPDRRFDPLWYSQPDDWEDADVDSIEEIRDDY